MYPFTCRCRLCAPPMDSPIDWRELCGAPKNAIVSLVRRSKRKLPLKADAVWMPSVRIKLKHSSFPVGAHRSRWHDFRTHLSYYGRTFRVLETRLFVLRHVPREFWVKSFFTEGHTVRSIALAELGKLLTVGDSCPIHPAQPQSRYTTSASVLPIHQNLKAPPACPPGPQSSNWDTRPLRRQDPN